MFKITEIAARLLRRGLQEENDYVAATIGCPRCTMSTPTGLRLYADDDTFDADVEAEALSRRRAALEDLARLSDDDREAEEILSTERGLAALLDEVRRIKKEKGLEEKGIEEKGIE